MISITKDNSMLGYKLLSSYSNISHFVTTRQGGVSGGNYESFNCTPYSSDNKESVLRNQQKLCNSFNLSADQLLIPYQVHGTEIAVIDNSYLQLTPEERSQYLYGVDALITDQSGCCLCVSTADCVPLLLYDTRKNVIAAIHAGWRGTVSRIVEKAIESMQKRYNTNPSDIIAAIGPSISLTGFEVGDEVYQTFFDEKFRMDAISSRNTKTGKWHIDLWEANRFQLLDSGVLPSNIELAGICTYQNHERFFSARRLGINSGRILSGIILL